MPRALPKLVVITTTVATARQAAALGAALVEARLAACVQAVPIRSTYRWKGRIERTREHLLSAKTRAARAQAAVRFIRARHPYDLPEILVTPVTGGLPAYRRWVAAESGPR